MSQHQESKVSDPAPETTQSQPDQKAGETQKVPAEMQSSSSGLGQNVPETFLYPEAYRIPTAPVAVPEVPTDAAHNDACGDAELRPK